MMTMNLPVTGRMYAPEKYTERRIGTLLSAIEEVRFATVIACVHGEAVACHVPLLVRRQADVVFLEGHVSRQNGFCRAAVGSGPVLAVFSGPHGYVSPAWMRETEVSGRTAPTWAYIAIQARGDLTWEDDRAWLLEHVSALAAVSEDKLGTGWSTDRIPADHIASMITGIDGFRIRIGSLEGVWKVLQFATDADRANIVEGLRNTRGLDLADAISRGVE